MEDETSVSGTSLPLVSHEQTFLAALRLRRESRGDKADDKSPRPSSELRYEQSGTRLHVLFHGRIGRKDILDVQEQVQALHTPIRQILLDVSDVRGLKLTTLAPLAMLGGGLERRGIDVRIVGVSAKLQREATAARLHHLLNFE